MSETELRETVAKAIMDADPYNCDCDDWPGCHHQYAVDADAAIAAARPIIERECIERLAQEDAAWWASYDTEDESQFPILDDEGLRIIGRIVNESTTLAPPHTPIISDGTGGARVDAHDLHTLANWWHRAMNGTTHGTGP